MTLSNEEFENIVESKSKGEFIPFLRKSEDGNFLEGILRPESYYIENLGKGFSIYKNVDNDDIVGFCIREISRFKNISI